MLATFSYQRAVSLKEAIGAATRPETRIMAGGTDLLGCLRDGVFQANRLVSLNGIKDLKGIKSLPGGGWRIGALTTLTEIAEHPKILEAYPVLAQAAASVATPQLRNQGTLGGNLCQRPRCWYFRGQFNCRRKGGDTCFAETGQSEFHAIFGAAQCYIVHPSDTAAALVALDARASITGPKGTRQVPLGSFFVLPKDNLRKETVLEPGEVLTEVRVNPLPSGARSLYRKVRERAAFDFALAGAAVVLVVASGRVQTARIVLSGVAPIPWRSAEAEKAITGQALDATAIAAAAEAAVKGASPMADNGYKVPLVRGVMEEVLTKLSA
jgi:xanthine dehydrogenase YagS FAD-binding subunit